MYAVTGANGQLGRLVIDALIRSVPADQVVALVRNLSNASDFLEKGVQVRVADYDRPETLEKALVGVEKLLLISATDVGRRAAQHQAVIDAAVKAGVQLIAYTSILKGDKSPLLLAEEHKATEAALAETALPVILLRNGWYTENYLRGLSGALEHGAIVGAAKDGRISLATRTDFADAAVAALLAEGLESRTYELAGDEAYTMAELAAEVARQSGKAIAYKNVSESEYAALMKSFGLPDQLSEILADAEAQAANGSLFDDGKDLSRLIGRPTTKLDAAVAAALKSIETK